jgi:putative nucleotidyltransferase with HDIG domain
MKAARLTKGGRLYVASVIGAGVFALLHSMYVLHLHPVTYHWALLAGLTLLTGSFTVRIPTIPARLSVSETFVFAAVLLFGPAAATMIVVLDALVISLWQKRRIRRTPPVLFNVAAPSVAIWLAAHSFYWITKIPPLAESPKPILPLLVPIIVLAVLYFVLNSVLVAWAIAFEKRVSAFAVWRDSFLWLSLNYLSGASVAGLLLPYLRPEQPEFAVIGILLPLLLVSYLTFKAAMGRVDDAHRHLEELNNLYLSTIETLAMAIDAKDQITHGHIRRVQVQAVALAQAMGVKESAQIRAIEAAALLHDMGKLAVPEYILNKPGPLTSAEFEKMKLHASVGADILSAIDFPYPVVPIVRHHHENWDGTGYPDKLLGAAIPIGARILSVVDCFDALTSDRPYRPRLSDEEALRILAERRGRMYDPLVVDSFVLLHTAGRLSTGEVSEEATFSVFSKSASSSYRESPDLGPLEDIAASGEEMLLLFELARSMNDRLGLPEVCEVVVKHLRRVVPSSLFVFYLHDSNLSELVCAFASGEHSSIVAGLRIPLGQRLTGWVGAHRQTISNSDPVLDLGDTARSVVPRLRSCLSTPLVVNDALIGVLSLYSDAHQAFTQEHQRIVEIVARQISATVLHTASPESHPNAAGTGLGNVAGVETLQPLLLSTGVSNQLCVILVRVLATGDLHLHQGDGLAGEFEVRLIQRIRSQIRPSDILVRHTVSHFVVIQFSGDLPTAKSTAARIRQLADSELLDRRFQRSITVGVSVAQMPVDGGSVEELISTAKHRLDPPSNPHIDSDRSPKSIH